MGERKVCPVYLKPVAVFVRHVQPEQAIFVVHVAGEVVAKLARRAVRVKDLPWCAHVTRREHVGQKVVAHAVRGDRLREKPLLLVGLVPKPVLEHLFRLIEKCFEGGPELFFSPPTPFEDSKVEILTI